MRTYTLGNPIIDFEDSSVVDIEYFYTYDGGEYCAQSSLCICVYSSIVILHAIGDSGIIISMPNLGIAHAAQLVLMMKVWYNMDNFDATPFVKSIVKNYTLDNSCNELSY